MKEARVLRFQYRTGHSYDGESLLLEQMGIAEDTLWMAVCMLTDQTVLARQLTEKAQQYGETEEALRFFEERGRLAEKQAILIRQLFENEATTYAE